MSSTVALREITNEISTKETQAPIAKKNWQGSHIKFDEEGNVEAVIKEAEPILSVPELEKELNEVMQWTFETFDSYFLQIDEREDNESSDETEDEEETEEEEEVSLWDYRDAAKDKEWKGTHIVFVENDEKEDEETTTDAPSTASSTEVATLEQYLSKLTTSNQQKKNNAVFNDR